MLLGDAIDGSNDQQEPVYVLLGNALTSSDDRRQPILESGAEVAAAPVPSPSAWQPAVAFTTVLAAPAGADPVPPPLIPSAGTELAPALPLLDPSETTVALPQAPLTSLLPPLAPSAVLPPSGTPSSAAASASDPAVRLSRSGSGPARLLAAGATRVNTFKLSVFVGHSIFCGPVRIWSGVSCWGLECLRSLARCSGVGEMAPGPRGSTRAEQLWHCGSTCTRFWRPHGSSGWVPAARGSEKRRHRSARCDSEAWVGFTIVSVARAVAE
ncbi:unnamed protein product [Coccothraustes coccothraustes]